MLFEYVVALHLALKCGNTNALPAPGSFSCLWLEPGQEIAVRPMSLGPEWCVFNGGSVRAPMWFEWPRKIHMGPGVRPCSETVS